VNASGDGGEGRFEALVAGALDGLPGWVQQRLENVAVVIADDPPGDQPFLLGLYQGIPLTQRGGNYAGMLPDRITLYRRPIEAVSRSDDELRERVRHTVMHELAHHFGISDDRLREIGRY
jgi:predicted Zn-dependent protease with MMP-like domain